MLFRIVPRNSKLSQANLNTLLNKKRTVRSFASTPNEKEKEKALEKKESSEVQQKNIEYLANEAKEKLKNLLAKYANYKREEDKGEERKGPFKNYFEDEERNKKSIMYYEDYFDKNTRKKDRENFINAVEAFKVSNRSNKLYLDFIYGALLKMKEFDAHRQLEAYRKLMEVFPIGPIRCENNWQRDNMHFPRHQNCAIQILEQMERNGVILDEDFVRLTIQIFGDWTHVVRKAKRQLYWLPKFKNANPYPVPSLEKMETMNEMELAIAALERMTTSADKSTIITVNHTNELELKDESEEKTWIITAQCAKQKQLLNAHKKEVPIFVEGPHFCWIRDKMVEYFLMKSDPLEENKEKMKQIAEYDSDDLKNMYNMFADPSKQVKQASSKKPELSVHEQADGNVYAVCCTGTRTKSSLYTWTKFLEKQNNKLKDHIIVYRYKEKMNLLAQINEEAK